MLCIYVKNKLFGDSQRLILLTIMLNSVYSATGPKYCIRLITGEPFGIMKQIWAAIFPTDREGGCNYYCASYNFILKRVLFWLKSGLGIRSFQKNFLIFAFFSVLYIRTKRSLHSCLFFIKERSDLCALFRSL